MLLFSWQVDVFLVKFNLFDFNAGFRQVFLAGLKAMRPKSFAKRRFTVLIETPVLYFSNVECIFLDKLCEDCTAICFRSRSSLTCVFRGRPDCLLSVELPEFLNLTHELCTTVLR